MKVKRLSGNKYGLVEHFYPEDLSDKVLSKIDKEELFRINFPNIVEVENAGNIFMNRMQELLQCGESVNNAIRCAAAQVWSAAKKYQAKRDYSTLQE